MSRTTLCVVTAGALAVLSLGMMAARYAVLGEEVQRPSGPGTWKVTLAVEGTGEGHAALWTASPLDLEPRQRLFRPAYVSAELTSKPLVDPRHPERQRVKWSQPGGAKGPFRARAEFHVQVGMRGARPASGAYAAPRAGEYLAAEPLIEASHERISAQARQLAGGLPADNQLDVAQALFRFVDQKVRNDLSARRGAGSAGSAVACLDAGGGDRAAKARLLAALLRNRNIPARLVTGVTLTKGPEQPTHYWVEAFIYEHWTPMCPLHHLFGRVPATYLILGHGDRPVVTGKRVRDLRYGFLVERVGREDGAAADGFWKRGFKALSLSMLPPADQRLVEVLLLLPLAALVICVFRNVIGMNSFGTFAPALIGLAFHHEMNSLPGILVFVTILLIGWLLRRLLDHYHLLQVPRVSMMLTLIMSVLIGLVVIANHYDAPTTRYISLFPMVILTGMVERFWTLETEDSTTASFKTLVQTMFIATVIALVLSRPFVVKHMFCYPETLGFIMAGQLLIGRYTGYRLTELFRFRDFLRQPA